MGFLWGVWWFCLVCSGFLISLLCVGAWGFCGEGIGGVIGFFFSVFKHHQFQAFKSNLISTSINNLL